jgi:hypothetical protein
MGKGRGRGWCDSEEVCIPTANKHRTAVVLHSNALPTPSSAPACCRRDCCCLRWKRQGELPVARHVLLTPQLDGQQPHAWQQRL